MGGPSHIHQMLFLGGHMISLRRLSTREDGQDLMEYGLLAALISIFALAAVRLLADQITTVFWGGIATIGF